MDPGCASTYGFGDDSSDTSVNDGPTGSFTIDPYQPPPSFDFSNLQISSPEVSSPDTGGLYDGLTNIDWNLIDSGSSGTPSIISLI